MRLPRRAVIAGAGSSLLQLGLPQPLSAADRESSGNTVTIGNIPASGLLFKDIVKVQRVEDPKVGGVEIYVSAFQRPVSDRLVGGDFFSDPAQSAVTCVRVGPVTLADDIGTTEEGEEVFSEARSLLFRSLNVRRLYDKESNTIVYVSYSTRLDKNDDENKSRFKTSMCAVPVR